MRRALQRTFSSAPPPVTPVARPRAVSSWGVHSKSSRHILRYAAAGGTLLAAGYVAYLNDFDAQRMVLKAQESWRNMWETTAGDPNVEDLQKALGPAPEAHYLNLIISVEDVLLLREWDRRHGYALHPREGMLELMRELLDPNSGVCVTLWSENSSQVAHEMQEKLGQALSGPAAHTPSLGLEHMFLRDGGKRKEKRLEYFNRDLRSVLLIDSNALSEALNPDNTVCVQSQRAAAAEQAAAAASRSSGSSSSSSAPSPDLTCSAIKALVTLIKSEAQEYGGAINVPRALKKVRGDAVAAGLGGDTMGIFAYLRRRAQEEAEAEFAKRNSGLGGLLRRSAADGRGGMGRATTIELANRRRYIDPGAELGEDSLLTRKVRETNRKLFSGGP